VEAGGVDATTSRRKRDDRGGGSGNCDGDGKFRAAAVTGFGDKNYNDTCQRPLWWGQLASGMMETMSVVDTNLVGSMRRTP
jgi:hypothetical protein